MSDALRASSTPGWWLAVLPQLRASLLYGLRFAASVCLALYVAFWLELDNPSWAGTTAAVVCQPVLGAALRKGSFRIVGTLFGAIFPVLLASAFPQSRYGYLIGLALWCGTCTFVSTLLRNFAAYAAALAGFTAAIVATDAVADPNQAFILAVTRASEITIGIVAASIVVAGTDLGSSRRRLASMLGNATAAVLSGLLRTLTSRGEDARPRRRALIGQVVALDPVIDAAIGEAVDLHFRQGALYGAIGGLLTALSSWRAIEAELQTREDTSDAAMVGATLPPAWFAGGEVDREACAKVARRLTILPAATPSTRLLTDRMVDALRGMVRAFDALELVVQPGSRRRPTRAHGGWTVPDLLPPLINAIRVVAVILAASLFWIVTEWPSGTTFITFVAVTSILLSPREDGFQAAIGFTVGTLIAAVLAAATHFAFLVNVETFLGFASVISLVMVPLAGLSIVPALTPWLMAAAMNFIPLLAPTNAISYEGAQFLSTVLAIVAGCATGAASLVLIPPLTPAVRARRLLGLTLRDVRAIARRRWHPRREAWQRRIYGRLTALPAQATPLQHAQLVTALLVGEELLRLRRVAHRFGLRPDLREGLDALAAGRPTAAADGFARFDAALAAMPSSTPGERLRLRARGSVLALRQAVTLHATYYGWRGI